MIEVAAVVLYDESGRVLTVRKTGTTKWMLPGGKLEPGETPIETAIREIVEELGVVLDARRLRLLGRFDTIAANEGVPLVAHVFVSDESTQPRVCAELEELRWVNPAVPGDAQAPLNIDLVFPLLIKARSVDRLP